MTPLRLISGVVTLLTVTACSSIDTRVISLAGTSIDPENVPLVNQLKAAAIAKYVTQDGAAFDGARRALIGLGVPRDSLPGLIVPNDRLNRYLVPKRIFFDDFAEARNANLYEVDEDGAFRFRLGRACERVYRRVLLKKRLFSSNPRFSSNPWHERSTVLLWGRSLADRVLVIAPTHRASATVLRFTSLHEAGHAELGVFNNEEIPDLFALSVGVQRDIDTVADVAAYVREQPVAREMQEIIEELYRYGARERFGPSRNAEARQSILARLEGVAAQMHEHDHALGDSLRSASDPQIHAMAYLLLKRQLPPPRAMALRRCLG